MNNTQENTTIVELENLEIESLHCAKLHVFPYDPNFVEASKGGSAWSHDGEGNLHTYDVEVEFDWFRDEDYYGNTFVSIERINVIKVKASDWNANPVVHTPQDHGRILNWIEDNYAEIQKQFDKQADSFFSDY